MKTMEQEALNPDLARALVSIKQDLLTIKDKVVGKPNTKTVEIAIASFREYLEEACRPNTVRSYQPVLNLFPSVVGGDVLMQDVTASTLQLFLVEQWGGNAATMRQRFEQLNRLYTFSIKQAQRDGEDAYVNPLSLLEIKKKPGVKAPVLHSDEVMSQMIHRLHLDRHRLMVAILATTGMRISELIGDRAVGKTGIRPMDIDGRVLTITQPKSGHDTEEAVIPGWLARDLQAFIKRDGIASNDTIIGLGYSRARKIIVKASEGVMSPHDIRKWCASYWELIDQRNMVSYVLRHHTNSLRERYVARFPSEEAAKLQDKHMPRKMFFK